MDGLKPNCYECKWRRNIPGDAHSRCSHPIVKEELGELDYLSSLLRGVIGCEAASKLNIMADEYGIRAGYFLWPTNYDPTWLRNCTGFEAKVKSDEKLDI